MCTSEKLLERLVRRGEVLNQTGVSQTTLYRLISQGRFPKPRRLVGKIVGWRLSEVQAWVNSRPVASGLGIAERPSTLG